MADKLKFKKDEDVWGKVEQRRASYSSGSFKPTNAASKLTPADDAPSQAGFFSRLGDTLSGGLKGSLANTTNSMGTLYQGGQKRRDAENKSQLDEFSRNLTRAKSVLASMESANRKTPGAIHDSEIQSQRSIVEDLQRKYDALSTVVGGNVQQKATDAAYKLADEIQQSGQKDLERAKDGAGALGQFAVDVGAAGVQLAGDVALGKLTGLGASGAIGLRGFGGGAQQARQEGATFNQQVAYGIGNALTEAATEKLFSVGKISTKAFGSGAADDILKGVVAAVEDVGKTDAGRKILNRLASAGVGFLSEGTEEAISGFVEPILRKVTYAHDEEVDLFQVAKDSAYQFLVGGALGGLMGGVGGTDTTEVRDRQVDTTRPESYNEPVSPAAAPQVQQMEQQAQAIQTANPHADVQSAAVTLFTQQGMKLKTAQQKAEVVEKLVAGKPVTPKEINTLEPTNKKSQALFTQLTGVQFPEGKLSIEQLYDLYRSANTVAQETRSAQEQVAEAAVAVEPVQTESRVVEHQDLDSNGNPVATFEEFLSHYQKQFPDGTQEDAAQMYEAYLYEHATVSYRGRRVSRDKFKEAMRQAPGGQQLTEQEMDAIFDDELNRQREDGKDATEHSVRNEEEAYGQQGPDPVHSSGLQGQPGEHPGEYGGGVSGGAGAVESQSAQGDGYAQDEPRGDAGDGSQNAGGVRLNTDTPVRESVASDGRTHFMELTRSAWDETLAAKEPAFARAGVSLRAAVDAIPIPGSRRTCDGVSLLGVESIVQTNSPYFTGEQLCDHEVLHQYFFRDKSLHKRCLQAYHAQVTPDVRNRLFSMYSAKYGEIYSKATGKKRDKIQNDIYEEIICDAYAGMNRDGAGADQLQNVIKPLVDEWCAERDAEMLEAEKKYSIDFMTEAIGLTFEKDGQLTVFKDAKGNRVDEVTEDMIRQSPFGAVLNASVTGKLITQEDADQQVKFFKDLYNLMLNTQDIDLLWAVSATLGFQPLESGVRDASTLNQKSRFAGYTKNSDPQYSTTVDFTTICVKTQAVIDAMSETMVRLGHGLTEQEIVEIVYKNTHEAGEPVPCPVCYVFSRWVGLGGLFDRMNQLQIQYANVDEDVLRQDIETLEDRIYEIMVEREYEIKRDKKSGKPKINGKAREAMYKELVNRQNELQAKQNQELVSGKKILTAAETAELETVKKQVGILDNWTWLRDVRLSETYEPVPAEILFDINAGKAFAEQYPESWKFRTTRGPAMGKAATPYADEHLGQILRGAGVSDLNKAELGDPAKNPFLKSKNGKLTKAAEKTLRTSRSKIKAQNLLNGQRYQSTSDFRFEYALDYLMSFVEMQALGAKVQLYTKVAESVRMFASVGAEVNCSLMPLGVGYRTNKDGSKTLVFSSVTGMNAEDAFNLSNEFDNVQPTMVGVDNTHIKLCLADERISFVIPYHASGASEGRYVALMDIVGESVAERTDYSNYQTDHRVEEPTEGQTAAYDLRLRLLTGKLGLLNDADKAVLKSNEILHNLYKRFYGQDADGNRSDIDPKYLSPDVRDSGKLFHDPECAGVFLTSEQAKTVMPFEYWDRTSTLETADLNGQAFVEYCESLGLHPRFSGWDAKGAYHADMDFSKESGYWKMLIDRRCYNRDGSYHEQQPINVTNFDVGFLLRDEAIKGIVQPSLVNDPAKTAKIAEKSVAEVQERRGEAKYSIAGEGANVDKTQLPDAQEMQRQGVPMVDIWAATDWWQGRDGKWRTEVTDLWARVLKLDGAGTLEQYLRHDDLFAAYPALKNLPVKVDLPANSKDLGHLYKGAIHMRRGLSRSKFRETVLHEIQHWIQEQEGFAGGSNYDIAYRRAFVGAYNQIRDTEAFKALPDYVSRAEAIEQQMLHDMDAAEYAGYNDAQKMAILVHDLYRDAIGEREARNTAERRHLADRKSEAPYLADEGVNTRNFVGERDAFRALHLQLGAKDVDSIVAPLYNKVRKSAGKTGGVSSTQGSEYAVRSGTNFEGAGVRGAAENAPGSVALEKVDGRDGSVIQASEESGAFDLPEAKYSITPEFEQWYKEGFADAETRDRVQQYLDALKTKHGAIPAGENPVRDVQMPRKNQKGERVHDTVRTVMEAAATPEKRLGAIETAVADGKLADVPVKNDVVTRRTREKLKRDGWQKALTDWTAEVRSGKSDADLVAMGAHLLNNAGNSNQCSGEQYVELLTDYSDLLHRVGQSLQAARILKRLSPEGKLYGIQQYVRKINENHAKTQGENIDPEAWANEHDITIDPSLVEAYRNAEDDAQRDKILGQIQQNIADQWDATWLEKLNNWRYLAMLGNFRTQIRNLAGNLGYQFPRMAKERIRGFLESVSGVEERATSVFRDAATFKAAKEDFKTVRNVILSGSKVDEGADYIRGIEDKRRIYKNPLIEFWRKKTNWAMDEGDAVFCRFTYADSLARFMAANHTSWENASEELRERGRELAIREAAEATYRDNSAAAKLVMKLKIKNPTTNLEKATNLLVEGVLPFKKTPANIMMRGFEYSPLGLIKSGIDAAQKAKGTKDITGNDIINELAKSITGTGLLVVGLVLAKWGNLTGAGPDDEKERELWELQGNQAYSLQFGNRTYTIDWLAPEAIPLLTGANIAEAIVDEDKNFMDAMTDVMMRMVDPVMEMSMLQGVNDLIESVGYAKTNGLIAVVTDAAWSLLMQYVPTILGQAERAADNTRRTTYQEPDSWMSNDMQYKLGQLSQKLPINWDFNQIPYIDKWGRTERNYESSWGNALAQFLSPSYQSIVNTSRMETELQRLYEATGESGILPSDAPKDFTHDTVKYKLTGAEYVIFATARGSVAHDLLTSLTGSAAYKSLSDAEKVEAVKKIYTEAAETAKREILELRGVELDGTDAGFKPGEIGLSDGDYRVAVGAAASIKAGLKNARTGDTIDNSKSLLIMEQVYDLGLKLTRAEYKKLFEALGVGKTVRGYTEKQVETNLKRMRRLAGE